ncbi:hypothetical protein L6Q21_09885 [Sandaracinobacter sp. RS1-74]|uniref:antitoxin Xre/MbcA/ParS-like domain-containing protein n=1 Tax=Sandaracinobacteroides sayramensis TaxID=2913411 RepID=UPI001EDA729B|nr:hypothetical protein [Sandaracinobacteroides sayramensis]MCG2841290.1 hypothetical protein [Sandaracinobacteroides sayramensis]
MTQVSLRTRQDALEAVMTLFQQKVGALSFAALRELAAALQRPQPDAERLARVVVSAADDVPPARMMIGKGLGEVLPEPAAMARLDKLTVTDETDEWAASELLGAGDITARLGVTRTTLDNWRRAHKILAFRKGIRNFVYPLRQFERKGPVGGLDKVRAHFDDDETAWEWLVTPNRFTGGIEPVEWLRKGKVEDVTRAAEGALDYQ